MLQRALLTFKALAIVGLSLIPLQPALAFVDDKRVLSDHRWYTEAYVKDYLVKNYPTLVTGAFHKTVRYAYAADAPVSGSGFSVHQALPMSARRHEAFLWSEKDAGKSLGAEIDKQCVLLISESLHSLKYQVRRARIKARDTNTVAVAVITDVRSGELTAAPRDLSTYKTRPISLIPPEGDRRLLCNVYRSTTRSAGITYEFSVVLTASGFYLRYK